MCGQHFYYFHIDDLKSAGTFIPAPLFLTAAPFSQITAASTSGSTAGWIFFVVVHGFTFILIFLNEEVNKKFN
jgi:hypothetical protein